MVSTTTDPESPTAEKRSAGWSRAVRGQTAGTGRKLMRRMMKTVDRWSLIEAGDRVMVAVSGGKDSYTLIDLLWTAKQRAPFDFDVVAVHLDQVQPDYNGNPLIDWFEDSGIPFEVLREDTYAIVKQQTKPGQAYCFLCSRLRRGILYSAAERLGCNKIAMGHHRDDALETLLMNMCFSGRLQSMPARYTTDDERFVVIRPLIESPEAEIIPYAEARGFPILPCNLCGSQDGLQRDEMRKLLDTLEQRIPDVRNVMLQSLRNVRPTHLLDTDLARAWETRPDDVRPWTPGKKGTRKTVAEVVARSGSLPIVE